MWRYTKRAFTLALVVAILAAGVVAVFAQKNGGRLLSIQTASMTPHYKKGTLVKVTRVPASQLAVGDVVTYISPKNSKLTITHRIVALPSPATKGKIITKGDANPVADAPFSPKYLVGRVDNSLPYAGVFIDFVRKPIGLALLIYVPALMVVINEIRILGAHYKRMRPYFSGYVMQALNKEGFRSKKIVQAVFLVPLALSISLLVVTPAHATLISNTVVLAGNRFEVVSLPAPGCGTEDGSRTVVNISGNSGGNNSVIVGNSSGQSAASGNADNSGSTNGGNATSGSASNTNCTNINIHIHN